MAAASPKAGTTFFFPWFRASLQAGEAFLKDWQSGDKDVLKRTFKSTVYFDSRPGAERAMLGELLTHQPHSDSDLVYRLRALASFHD